MKSTTPKVKSPRSKASRKGIFCLEGDWTTDLTRPSSVRPILQLLHAIWPYPPFIHRGVSTRGEFEHYLRKWTQKQYRRSYPILYLAFHGVAGTICIGDQRKKGSNNPTLDEIAKVLGPTCEGRIIHIGGCESLKGDERHLQRFLRTTRASAVTGYETEVDWVKSTVFEALLLETLQDLSTTRKGGQALEGRLKDKAGGLVRDLRFRVVVRKD